jgi:hypothetical protein
LRRRPAKEKSGKDVQKPWVNKLLGSPAPALGAALYSPSPLYLGALKSVSDAGLSP